MEGGGGGGGGGKGGRGLDLGHESLISFRQNYHNSVKTYTTIAKVEQEVKCYFYIFAHTVLSISAMLQVKLLPYRGNGGYFENKRNVEFCIAFDS